MAAAALVVLAAGCGTENGGSPGSSESSADAGGSPACSEVWVDGATLPTGYDGCYAAGVKVGAVKHRCGFGSPIVEYDGRFYAVVGKQVNETPDLATSAQFKRALASCQG